MTKKTALDILKWGDPSQLTDEAAILILLMKYRGELRKTTELLWQYSCSCPLCHLHSKGDIKHHCLTGDKHCPWIRFSPVKHGGFEAFRYSCDGWAHGETGANISHLSDHPEALAERIAMLKDWLKRVRKGE